MPGGRLTQQERQQIASGLADGLAYAEIARRLERPTSTVTREVMRNGGPTAYRPELAQRATEQRAHRRRRGARQAKAAPDAYGRDPEAVRAFEETLTTVFIASGTPRMMARVMACLTLSDSGSLTAAELAERLRVSPASVSKAIAFLETQDLVRRFRDEGGRRERYGFDEDIWYRSMAAGARSTAQIAATSREGVDVMGPGTPAATRLENAARFLDFVSETMLRAAEEARDLLHGKPHESAEQG
ncbi:helix-turn-helix domain-containing protein [Streptomyces cellulosae]|uniref:helix-turn-helix domain-containing protein n=1 Tax=unclassified Streptomyces TaxID=2593676 RepID=UPI00048A701A|nr:helix-turn-helix domain-containing protein [Streptomyces sp. MD20-1-1]WSB85117.1 helix-turn-helix domain-containing protein [Streptomyces cellulosae]WTC18043.1 helix-turn-helix domain-containing protein [Streptomyces cellulosae]